MEPPVRSPRYGHCGTCVARCKIYSPTSHGGVQHGYREFKMATEKRTNGSILPRVPGSHPASPNPVPACDLPFTTKVLCEIASSLDMLTPLRPKKDPPR